MPCFRTFVFLGNRLDISTDSNWNMDCDVVFGREIIGVFSDLWRAESQVTPRVAGEAGNCASRASGSGSETEFCVI